MDTKDFRHDGSTFFDGKCCNVNIGGVHNKSNIHDSSSNRDSSGPDYSGSVYNDRCDAVWNSSQPNRTVCFQYCADLSLIHI